MNANFFCVSMNTCNINFVLQLNLVKIRFMVIFPNVNEEWPQFIRFLFLLSMLQLLFLTMILLLMVHDYILLNLPHLHKMQTHITLESVFVVIIKKTSISFVYGSFCFLPGKWVPYQAVHISPLQHLQDGLVTLISTPGLLVFFTLLIVNPR